MGARIDAKHVNGWFVVSIGGLFISISAILSKQSILLRRVSLNENVLMINVS